MNIYIYKSTHERGTPHGNFILPQLDEFYLTTAGKKIVKNCKCIVPNFIND